VQDDLPSGTVTFLFTDVEGSTRLLHEVGAEAYASALAEHRRILRGAFARYGGVEVDVKGDEFFVVFPSAPGAAAAAREVVAELASGPIRVRIGVHTGTALLTDEGYIGVDVHRAARIAAAGHGGQALLSESTASLVEEDVRLLGEYRLRDLLEPIRLYQLGEGEFPPLSSLGGTNLPVQPNAFLGREPELARVLSLLSDAHVRLLTLTGAGGTGKTRLALQAAAEAAGEYPDGVFWVPLQALRDPNLVEPAIASTIGARNGIAEHLGVKRALLLLDNFEQVVSAAPRLRDLCAAAPNVKLLVTSREPLHLAAEREYAVPPMREHEAVVLFGERARAVKWDFLEDDAVPEICRRLDCLPLALELAAARVKALSTGDLLRRLDRRLPLLTGGPRDAPERQRTLRATIAWSYELLEAEEQRVFASLAVFSGGFTIDAAEHVCGADLDVIASLVDKSLLRHDGERYFLLEVIAEYALERLEEAGELEPLRRRHADYYLEFARSVEDLIRSPRAAALLDRLERDHENLRAALAELPDLTSDRALRLAIWGLAGRLQSFGDAALDRGDVGEAERLYRESLEIGRRLSDDLLTAYCLAGLAAVAAARGERAVAARLWGCVRNYEETSGEHLYAAERARYERMLVELEGPPADSPDFVHGRAMTLEQAVEYTVAPID
jgi:predicted ATPase